MSRSFAPWTEHEATIVRDMIPNDRFRERYLELIAMGETPTTMCERAGWVDRRGYANTSQLQRACGVRTDTGKRNRGRTRRWIRRDTANVLLKALNLDPADVPEL